ncbi:MAG: SCO family protein [Enterobacterales bacterium]|nr:SCO family protein [Enterobacterales bacterium]
MKKNFPYVLIASALIAGIYVANNMGLYDSDGNNQTAEISAKNSNRIDNHFKSFLIYPKKNPLKTFNLVDQDNNLFTNKKFNGYWNFIFSGYTNCPDVCPNTLNQMVKLYQKMPEELKSQVHFIFLTVDPERDSAQHLKAYLDYFDTSFIGLTGDLSQIDILIKDLGGVYSINKDEGEFYSVDHSARIFIVNPQAERFGIIDGLVFKQQEQDQLLDDLSSLILD